MKGGCKKGPDRKKATKIMNQAMRNTLKQDKHVEKPHFIRFFIDLSLFATNKLHLSATLEQALYHSPYIENDGSFITLFRLFPKSQRLLGTLGVYAFGYPQTGYAPFGFSLSVLNLFFLSPKTQT